MSIGEKYLLAAYLVFLALVLAYVVIMVVRLGRLEREVAELRDRAAEREPDGDREPEPVA